MELMAGMSHSRRAAYASHIRRTSASLSPVSASSAAACEIELGFDVAWLWILLAALMISALAIAYPRRQPVMAYVFDIEFTMMTVSGYCSNQRAADTCSAPP